MKANIWTLVSLVFTVLLWVTISAVPSHASDPAVGKAVYDENCSKCHGTGGKGDGTVATKMKIEGMKDYTNKQVMAALKDEELTEMTKKGGKALNKSAKMPSYEGKLTDDQIASTVAYIRSLSK